MLLTPGYWHSTYYPNSYWLDDYWSNFGIVTAVRRGLRNFGFSMRSNWR